MSLHERCLWKANTDTKYFRFELKHQTMLTFLIGMNLILGRGRPRKVQPVSQSQPSKVSVSLADFIQQDPFFKNIEKNL